jgi:hypothetical protein
MITLAAAITAIIAEMIKTTLVRMDSDILLSFLNKVVRTMVQNNPVPYAGTAGTANLKFA